MFIKFNIYQKYQYYQISNIKKLIRSNIRSDMSTRLIPLCQLYLKYQQMNQDNQSSHHYNQDHLIHHQLLNYLTQNLYQKSDNQPVADFQKHLNQPNQICLKQQKKINQIETIKIAKRIFINIETETIWDRMYFDCKKGKPRQTNGLSKYINRNTMKFLKHKMSETNLFSQREQKKIVSVKNQKTDSLINVRGLFKDEFRIRKICSRYYNSCEFIRTLIKQDIQFSKKIIVVKYADTIHMIGIEPEKHNYWK